MSILNAANTVKDHLKNNPFTPVFGKVPPFMAGREHITDAMTAVFHHPDNNPDRCSLFVGARGTGKTALLTYLAREAEENGWIAANTTAAKGMLEDIRQQTVKEASHLLPPSRERKVSSIDIAAIGGISWSDAASAPENWRSCMSDIIDELTATNTGLLITVDEVDPSLDEMAQLVTTYQHFVREDRKVALLLAGLPHRMSGLLSGKSTSFLRRAAQHKLGSIPRYEVEEAFRLTVESGGSAIDDEALAEIVEAIDGFPFMFQLVGYRAWNAAGAKKAIDQQSARQGIRLAKEELENRIFDATYQEFSRGDIEFLEAMAAIGGSVPRSALQNELGKSSSHISTYKRRLLEAGVIDEKAQGLFSFALPGFGAYIAAKRNQRE